ncbi:MAG: 7-cyano-7-deazaguanine synthase QueC [Thermodesulfovibrionia bacterium]|nr:MAG: 7-cyano-7-deazaguanine synthase QueC [Thermodesulfovibrionia bacterium]
MKPAIVLLSGGIDSTVTLAIVRDKGFEAYAVSFNYGQRHIVELNRAKQCAAYFNIQKHLIIKFDLGKIGGSALTSDMEVPKDQEVLTEIPVTYVPARNTIFLSFALAFAESAGAEDIFIGVNAVDYSGYPDCRPEFINAFEDMANLATKASVEGTAKFKIHTPLIDLAKGDIIKKGADLGVDFAMTWSCYDPQKSQMDDGRKTTDEEDRKTGISSFVPHPSSFGFVPCMRCDSCLLRAKGFREAGIKDPLSI